MQNGKLDHYNPNYPYKKKDITINKSNKCGYPILESVNNGALYPEGIKNRIDMDQINDFD
ncbi:MAG: hypothetical protein ACI8WT_003769 [Clostridium sp.]|jgi:hypothetical protein